MSNIIISLKADDLQSFEARLDTFKVTRPIYRGVTEARVMKDGMVIDTMQTDKEDVEAVALDDFKEVLDWLNCYTQKQTFLAKDLTQTTLNYLFQTEEGRNNIKEMLKTAANKNKDKFKGSVRQEFFNILEVEFK